MHIDFIYDKANSMPAVSDPNAVKSLRIWNCKFRTLEPLSVFLHLRTLQILTFPDDSLTVLAQLSSLRYLRIVHLPKVTDLTPLIHLHELESLSLETLPSWDASSKVTVVNSLDPLAQLPRLKHLSLFGVVPPDRTLAAIERCENLVSGRFSKYPKKEVDRFYNATGLSNAHIPEPDNELG